MHSNVRHGCARVGSVTPEYSTWISMRHRCNNPKHRYYAYYGARGIKVCKEWDQFEKFLADMGYRPEGMSLDRINNDLGYSPDNCRWATRNEQAANRRQNLNAVSRIKGVSWDAFNSSWSVLVQRNKKKVLQRRRKDFFEACCLIKSFEAKEALGATNTQGQTSTTDGSQP